MNSSRLAALFVGTISLLLIALASAALAQDRVTATLELDEFSLFHFAGTNAGGALPSGVELTLNLARRSDSSWDVSVPAGTFQLPPLEYPDGQTVLWKLKTDARGSLERGENGISLNIQALAMALSERSDSNPLFILRFTTGRTQKRARGYTARADGILLQREDGYVRLVASGVNPKGARNAPGEPFYVVLSGTVRGLPAALLR